MDPRNDLDVNLSDFSIIVKGLVHNEEKFDGKDLAVILLNSLHESYKEIWNEIKCSSDKLTKAIVVDASRSRN